MSGGETEISSSELHGKKGGVNHLEVDRPVHQFSTTGLSSLYTWSTEK
jgi:hypothetical protein